MCDGVNIFLVGCRVGFLQLKCKCLFSTANEPNNGHHKFPTNLVFQETPQCYKHMQINSLKYSNLDCVANIHDNKCKSIKNTHGMAEL